MSSLSPVTPVKPAAAYLGGKRCLSRRLVEIIESVPHESYIEPFVGMGGVFLRRRSRPGCEVINDLSGDVACFYRVVQEHYSAFMDMLRWQVASREQFDRLMRQDPETLTDLRRAARFLYLQRAAYGGKVVGRNFGVSVGRPSRFNVTRLARDLEDLHDRLAGVVIERLPWSKVIDRYDAPASLFYLDPPYFGCERDYGADVFSRDQFAELAARLSLLKGRFVLSLNDRPEVRALFSAFDIRSVKTVYGVAAGAREADEVIITNGAPVPRDDRPKEPTRIA